MAGFPIPLTRGFVALVDEEDAAEILRFSWRVSNIGTCRYPRHYAIRCGDVGEPNTVLMHRHIMRPPEHLDVDHFDNDGLNNQRCNLRMMTRSANISRGRPRQNKHGFPGVVKTVGGLYYGRAVISGGQKYTASYSNPHDASLARDRLLEKHRGAFVMHNRVPQISDDPAQFGASIRCIRLSLGVTQREFARQIGVARSTLACFEAGHDMPGAPTLSRISCLLGVPFECVQS